MSNSAHPRSRFWLPLALCSLPLLLARCGQNTATTPTPASGTFGNVYAVTLKTACIECHVPGGAPTTQHVALDFSTQATAYTTLTNPGVVSGDADKNICPNVPYVTAGHPEKSYLAAVLFQTYNVNNFDGVSGCQPYTAHLTDQHLTADEQTSIVNWITNGAQNN